MGEPTMTKTSARRVDWWMIGVLAVAALGVTGLGWAASRPEADEPAAAEEPAHTEDVEGTDIKKVVLTDEAAERLGLKTAKVTETTAGGRAMKSVPYGALLYEASGDTWTYAQLEPLVYMRQRLTVDHVDGDNVLVTDGPAAGTEVVTVGAAELQGVEYGVGEE